MSHAGPSVLHTVMCQKLRHGHTISALKKITTFQCDISQYDDLHRIQQQVVRRMGDVTMVVNVAGINNKSLILDLDKKKIDRMIDINLKSRKDMMTQDKPWASRNVADCAPPRFLCRQSLFAGDDSKQARPLFERVIGHGIHGSHAPK